MNEKKINRRTLKTKKLICDGLAELLTKKELKNITVQELADKVDIHRVTLYHHYMDIYDVYEHMEKDILIEIGLLILQYHESPIKQFYASFVEYVEKNPLIFKMIFSPYNTEHLSNKVNQLVEGLLHQIWSESHTANNGLLDYTIHYHSVGFMAIISKWVQSDYSQPKEFIINTIVRLDQNIKNILSQ